MEQEPEYHVWEFIRDTDEFANVRNRLSYQKVLNGDHGTISIHIGVPITYAGEDAYLLIENTIRTDTVFNYNRYQLILLTILLTIAGSRPRGRLLPVFHKADLRDQAHGRSARRERLFRPRRCKTS